MALSEVFHHLRAMLYMWSPSLWSPSLSGMRGTFCYDIQELQHAKRALRLMTGGWKHKGRPIVLVRIHWANQRSGVLCIPSWFEMLLSYVKLPVANGYVER